MELVTSLFLSKRNKLSKPKKNFFPRFWFLYLIIVMTIWSMYMFSSQRFHLMAENFEVIITMIFGSFIAGASSEGGGAIAFPVFTLILNLPADLSRNFSLAIQSLGMTSAAIFVIERGIRIEKRVIFLGSLGGIFGFFIGTLLLVEHINPVFVKLLFVSIWLSFSLVLISNNTDYKSLVGVNNKTNLLLFLFAVIGGVFSAFFGNGIDILVFSLLTLKFRLNEKVATHTSIILMAIISIFGFLFHVFVLEDFRQRSMDFWLSSIPIVIFIAPLGAFIISKLNKLVVRNLLISIIIVQYIGAILILKLESSSYLYSFLIAVFGFVFFYLIKEKGQLKQSSRSET